MSALPKSADYITVEEYLEGEQESEIRHEYFDGQVYAMAGGTSRHNAAALFLAGKIANHLENGPCEVFMADFRVQIEFLESELYYYPDVFVACEPDDKHRLFRKKPKFWLEVMSDDESRHNKDRVEKYLKDRVEKYLVARRFESMEEYVLVSSDVEKPEVSVFRKSQGWEPPEVVKSGEIELQTLGLTISVDALYKKLASIEMT